MKLSDLRLARRHPAFKGRIMIDVVRGVVRVRAWPRPRKTLNAKSPAIANMNAWFKQANFLAKYVPIEDQILARELSGGTAQYPRDFLIAAMAGSLVEGIDVEGVGSYERPAISPRAYPPAAAPANNQPASDPYWSSVQLLIGVNGDVETSTGLDLSSFNRTVTLIGSAGVDEAETKYYPASLFIGTNTAKGTLADGAQWQIAAGQPFTIETFVRFDQLTSDEAGHAFLGHYASTSNQRAWQFYHRRPAETLAWIFSTNGLNPGAAGLLETPWHPEIDHWYHIAVTRDSSSACRLFIQGYLQETKTIAGASFNSTSSLYIGAENAGSPNRKPLQGNLAGLRFTKGECRYTADFTPPTGIFGGA